MKMPEYLAEKVKFDGLCGRQTDYATEAGILGGLADLLCDLSPENLTCDGELSAAAVARKRRRIQRSWTWFEAQLGRKVSEDEVIQWDIKKRGTQ